MTQSHIQRPGHIFLLPVQIAAVMAPDPRKVKFRDSMKQMGKAVKFFIHLLQSNLGERTTQRTACKKTRVNKYFKCHLTNDNTYLSNVAAIHSSLPSPPFQTSLSFLWDSLRASNSLLYSSLPFFLWHLVPMHLSLPGAHTHHSPAHHSSYFLWSERKWSFQGVSNLETFSRISIQEASELGLQAQKRPDPNFKGKKMSRL